MADPRPLSTIGPYEILECLGRGGMGAVYRARHRETGEIHAVKVILEATSPEAVERFRREAAALARIDHPGVCTIHGSGIDPRLGPYYAMELLDGTSLDRLGDGNPIPPEQAARIARTAAEAMAACHAAGVLHRDLKPKNILIRTDGTPVIVDFGLARLSGVATLTKTGEMVGTPEYMAPEQATGEIRRVGPATDIYGLGATLYAMLAGSAPFRGSSVLNVIHAILMKPPPPLQDGVPAALEAIVLKAMAKAPDARYPSMADLATDLARFLSGEPIPEPRGLPRRGRRAAAAGAALVVLVLLGAGWVVFRGRHPDPDAAPPTPDGPPVPVHPTEPAVPEVAATPLDRAIEAFLDGRDTLGDRATVEEAVDSADTAEAARALRWLGRIDAFEAACAANAHLALVLAVRRLDASHERCSPPPADLTDELARALAIWVYYDSLDASDRDEMWRWIRLREQVQPAVAAVERELDRLRSEGGGSYRRRYGEVLGLLPPARAQALQMALAPVPQETLPLDGDPRSADPMYLGVVAEQWHWNARSRWPEVIRRRRDLILEPPGDVGSLMAEGRRARLLALRGAETERDRARKLFLRAAVLSPRNGAPLAAWVPLEDPQDAFSYPEVARAAYNPPQCDGPDYAAEAYRNIVYEQGTVSESDGLHAQELGVGLPDLLRRAAPVLLLSSDAEDVARGRELLSGLTEANPFDPEAWRLSLDSCRAAGDEAGIRAAEERIRAIEEHRDEWVADAAADRLLPASPEQRRQAIERALGILEAECSTNDSVDARVYLRYRVLVRDRLPPGAVGALVDAANRSGSPEPALRALAMAVAYDVDAAPPAGLGEGGGGEEHGRTWVELLDALLGSAPDRADSIRASLAEEARWRYGPHHPVAAALLSYQVARTAPPEARPAAARRALLDAIWASDAAPGSAGVFVLLGLARLLAENPRDAERDLDAAIDALPGDGAPQELVALARAARAAARAELGHDEGAREDLDLLRALGVDPRRLAVRIPELRGLARLLDGP